MLWQVDITCIVSLTVNLSDLVGIELLTKRLERPRVELFKFDLLFTKSKRPLYYSLVAWTTIYVLYWVKFKHGQLNIFNKT